MRSGFLPVSGAFMFDVVQICWWFLQVTLIGYLCVYKLLETDEDRLLFAPVAGLAAVLCVANAVWMWMLPTHLTSFILACAVGAGIFLFIRTRPKPPRQTVIWMIIGVALLAMYGSLIPFGEKVFQGFPIDRFGFLSAHILYQQHDMTYFLDALTRLVINGEKQVEFINPMIGAAFGEMQGRTACGLAFISLSWLTPYDMHGLANAWETFLRVVQFSSLLALFSVSLNSSVKGRALAGILALASVFGYWFQYMKDYNSWPHMATLALAAAILAILVSIANRAQANSTDRNLILLLTLAMCVTHPEFGAVLCLGFGVVIVISKVLRRALLSGTRWIFEGAALVAAIFLINPYIIPWLQRIFAASAGYPNGEIIGRGVYGLFGAPADVHDVALRALSHPFSQFRPAVFGDIVIGTLGLPYVTFTGSAAALGTALLISALMLSASQGRLAGEFRYGNLSVSSMTKVLAGLGIFLIVVGWFWPLALKFQAFDLLASMLLGGTLLSIAIYCAVTSSSPGLKILVGLPLFLAGFFFVSLFAYHWFGILGPGAAYRSLPYLSIFACVAFWALLVSSGSRAMRILVVGLATANVVFAASVFWVTNHGGMETYPEFYPLRNSYIHTYNPMLRNQYDFDYRDLAEPLSRCNLVFLDFKNMEPRSASRFHAANLMMFLDNNRVRYVTSYPILTAYNLLGDAINAGFKRENVMADCLVDQEMRNGRVSYRLTQFRWQ